MTKCLCTQGDMAGVWFAYAVLKNLDSSIYAWWFALGKRLTFTYEAIYYILMLTEHI